MLLPGLPSAITTCGAGGVPVLTYKLCRGFFSQPTFLVATMAGLQRDTAIIAGLGEAKMDEAMINEKRTSSEQSVDQDVDHHLDGIHDGLEFPTEEERLSLRRVADAIPWNAYSEDGSAFRPIITHIYHS